MKKSRIIPLIIITAIITCTIVFQGIIPHTYDIEVGKASPEDIYSLRDIVDRVTTESKRKAAESLVLEKYAEDSEATENSQRALNEFISLAESVRKVYKEDKKIIEGSLMPYLDDSGVKILADFSDKKYASFIKTISDVQKTLLSEGIRDKQKALNKAYELYGESFDDEEKLLAEAVFKNTLIVNSKIDKEATEKEKEAARESISEVVYKQNQVIIRKGDIVNEAHFQLLSDMGLVKSSQTGHLLKAFGTILTVLLCLFFTISLSKREISDIGYGKVLLLCIVIIFTMLLTLLGKKFISPYVIPLTVSAALCSVIFGTSFALMINIPILLLGTLAMGTNALYFSAQLLAGSIAVLTYSNKNMRTALVTASLKNCALYFVIFGAAALCEGLEIANVFSRALYGLLNGFITGVLLIGMLPFFEAVFNITTPYKLSEITNPNEPLLKKLLLEAPGTYHHSLMVGNLAEAACNAVGGNAILARAGAYYHDIGKLKRPAYFSENQYNENPHDKLTPELSAATIISHVTGGEEIAKQYKLPPQIRRIIKAHHGTTTVSYFYHKAKKLSESGIVDIEKYRYKNILPKSREEVSVMLADSVEAAVRSLDDKSAENVRGVVENIISARLSDGQLSQSDITLADLEKMKEAYINTLSGYFHNRVKYPEENGEKNEK